jgi:hypothetical protein
MFLYHLLAKNSYFYKLIHIKHDKQRQEIQERSRGTVSFDR